MINDNLETTYKLLENYIFDLDENPEESSQLALNDETAKSAEPANVEVEMVDTVVPLPADSSNTGVSGTDDAKTAATDLVEKSATAGGEES